MAALGRSRNEPAFCFTKPFDQNKATCGNGTMVVFKIVTKEQVDAFYAKTIVNRAKDDCAVEP